MTRRAVLLALLAASCGVPQPCPEPLHECGGQCVDLQSNRQDCGGCGVTCGASQVCQAGGCTPDVRAPCANRVGGAFVTLGVCGSAVKAWITQPAFVDEAASYVGTTALPRTPLLAILERTDCDAQWSWTVGADASWVSSVTVPCTAACPSAIETAVRANTLPLASTWCPTPATSLVLAVDRRPAPP
jgi:hypothetical protein